MIGLVLCGGESRRMGSDKGLLKQGDKTWAQIAEQKLSALQFSTAVSVNPNQLQAYSQIFPAEKLIIDNHILEVKGPLLGLLSCHLRLPNEELFVLASDMTRMTDNYLQQLTERCNKNKHEAFIYSTEGRLQPLCGIYTSEALKKIYGLYVRNELKKFSMMYVLEQLNTHVVEVPAKDLSIFNNYNSPAELPFN